MNEDRDPVNENKVTDKVYYQFSRDLAVTVSF